MNSVTINPNKKVYSPIRFFGGKANLSEAIINLIPKHICYFEVFAGGSHVLSRKTKSKVEVINDLDENLVNFLMVLRNQKEELINEMESLPTSRSLFEKWATEPWPADDFSRAVRWFYLLRQKIVPANNQMKTLGWRSGKFKNSALDYQNAITRLSTFQERMKKVMIECLDFEEAIHKYDAEDTFFLIDPPYRGREKYYKGNFNDNDHLRLANVLNTIKGKALVTHIEDPLYEELYKGWNQKKVINLAHKGVIKAEKGQSKTVQTEIFYMNYDPIIQQALF